MRKQTPKWVDQLLDWYCHPDFIDEIRGDLYAYFQVWEKEKGIRRAKFLYAWNALQFLRMYNSKFSELNFKSTIMIGHFLKVSFRNFKKHKTYNVANILGLTLGIACSLMMVVHVKQELSYEKSYPKHERIARVSMLDTYAKSSPVFAEEFRAFFPDVENIGRFARYSNGIAVLSNGEYKMTSENIFYADQSTIDIFDLEFVQGSPSGALERPKTVVITEKIASGLFKKEDAIGQVVNINGHNGDFEITGVIKDFPSKSHIKSDALISMPTFYQNTDNGWLESRTWMVMYTYVLMQNENDLFNLRSNLADFQEYYLHDWPNKEQQFARGLPGIMKLTDIHLHSDKIQEMGQNSNYIYIQIFSALAAIIILIATVNFVNIFTTLALKRSKEIGLRKAIGANRQSLVIQLLSEATISAVFATLLGLTLCIVCWPFYNSLVGSHEQILDIISLNEISLLLLGAILLGLVSGLYPALVVTKESFLIAQKGESDQSTGVALLRKGLIIFQFALSLFILVGTYVVYNQMEFIQNRDTGYNAEKVVFVKMYGELYYKLNVDENKRSALNRLKSVAGVTQVTRCSRLIGESLSIENFKPVDLPKDSDFIRSNMIWVDENYMSTLNLKLLSGRGFRHKADTTDTFIINEKLASMWKGDPVGQMASYRGRRGVVVGVVADYNHYSLHKEVEPTVLCYQPSWTSHLLVKMESENMSETLSALESEVKAIAPSALFHCNILDQKIDDLYSTENVMLKVFKVFAFLALIISCVGLLGLSAIEVQRRTKEIGIRKVLGASMTQLMSLLGSQFMRMITISIFIGVPLSYLAVKEWLANFSYQTDLDWTIFTLPSLALLGLALLVVVANIFDSVRANPVDALRDEQ